MKEQATLAGLLGLLACSDQEPAFSAPHDYRLRGTTVLAVGPAGAPCGVSNGSDGSVSLQQPPTAPEELRAFVELRQDGAFAITDTGGCVIAARANDELNRLSARDASCTLADDSPLTILGVTARTYHRLELDFVAKRWFQLLSTQQVDAAGVAYDSCVVGEGWLVDEWADAPTGPGPSLRRYDGTYAWFAEQPEGGPVCEFLQGEWETEGYVRLERSADNGRLEVYEEGVGCSLSAESDDGVRFEAVAAPCAWPGPVSVRELGVVERTFDSWRYHSDTGELVASGRQIRETEDGERLLSCFTLDLVIDEAEN